MRKHISKNHCFGALTALIVLAVGLTHPEAVAQSMPTGSSGLPRPGSTVRFTHLTSDDGLAENSVEKIYQDKQGFIWIGTRDGLSRYDGYRFVNYRNDPNNVNSLSNNWVRDLYEDADGMLWIATEGGGVNRFDPRHETFTRFLPDPRGPNTIGGDRVNHIFHDSRNWFWFVGGELTGLNLYDPQTQVFTRLRADTHDSSAFQGFAVLDMLETTDGAIWLAATNMLAKYDGAQNHFSYYPPPTRTESHLTVLKQASAGNLWVGGNDGLYLFNIQHETFTLVADVKGINALVDDTEGNLWMATRHGLLVLDPQRNKVVRRFNTDSTWPSGLNSDNISALYRDRAGVIWIGTQNNGLNRYDPHQTRFGFFRHDPNVDSSLAQGSVDAIAAAGGRRVWVGSGDSLSLLDLDTGVAIRYSNSLLRGPIHSLLQDRAGVLWVGSANLRILSFDPAKSQWTLHVLQSPVTRPTPPKAIVALYEDPAGTLWAVVNHDGLFRLDATGTQTQFYETPETLPPPNLPPPPPHVITPRSPINSVFADRDGKLWLSTLNGLQRFDPDTGLFETFRVKPPPGPDSYMEGVRVDQQGLLWVASHDGLIRFDPDHHSAKYYTEKDGLPSSFVVGLVQDAAGDLWLSTTKGLSRFSPATETFRNYDISDGLQGGEFNPGSALQLQDGTVLFGGANGLNVFDPQQITDDGYEPPVVLTELQLANKPVVLGPHSVLSAAIWAADGMILPPDQNELSFEFSALSYATPSKNRYRYQLEGLDNEWTDTHAARRFATYANLPAGDYVFRVQGSNADGVWSKQAVAFAFTITPPWWQTWWFRVAFLVVTLAAVLGGYRWQVRSISERNHTLEKEIAERTAALRESESQLRLAKDAAESANRAKSAFLANMSHELRSPLNAVLGFAQLTRREQDLPAQAQENLDFILRSGQHLLRLINQVLDLSKIEAERMTLEEEEFDLQQMLLDLYGMFGREAQEKKLRLRFDLASNLPQYVWTDGIKLRQVLINLLSNALKFTHHGSVVLRVHLAPNMLPDDVSKASIQFEVEDTGEGIASEEMAALFEPFAQTESGRKTREGTGLGLRISHKIVQLLGGELTVESAVGRGSVFRFAVWMSMSAVPAHLGADEAQVNPALTNASEHDIHEFTALRTLPPDLRTRLREGSELGDMALIDQAIADIQPQHPDLAASLTKLARRFDYDQLLQLLKETDLWIR